MHKLILDTCCDNHGKWHSLKLMRNAAFGLGLVLAVASVFGDWYGHAISFETWFTLLCVGLGSHAGRIYEIQQNRKTADANGHALIQVGTEAAPADPVVPAASPKADEAQEIEQAV